MEACVSSRHRQKCVTLLKLRTELKSFFSLLGPIFPDTFHRIGPLKKKTFGGGGDCGGGDDDDGSMGVGRGKKMLAKKKCY